MLQKVADKKYVFGKRDIEAIARKAQFAFWAVVVAEVETMTGNTIPSDNMSVDIAIDIDDSFIRAVRAWIDSNIGN